MLALTHATVVSGGRVEPDRTVLVDGDRIAAVVPAASDEALDGARVVDVGGRIVTPGLIDLHVHGAAGHAFDDADGDAVTAVLRHLAAAGVTSIQLSLVSAPVDVLTARIASLSGLVAGTTADAARLLGVHLEGPFLAAAQCGAHDPAVLLPPSPREVDVLLEHAATLRMITLAPELPGAVEATRRLAAAGVVVAAGHSDATAAQLGPAVDAGLRHVTHLWSGQSTTRREGPWRIPGLLEGALAAPDLTAEVIADGRHLPPELLEIARRCVGDRLVVVSDGTPGTGMPPGHRYRLATVECVVADGVGMVAGADAFGGSTSTLPQMLSHLHDDLGWPLAEVVAAATSRPAAVAGLTGRRGSVAAGMDADLAIFDPGFRAWATVLRGRWLPAPPSGGPL
ncbi:N-acetylglucosamine-6-phosphate deacetylase [Jiangella mangrovi]|uniref:N-acetylglucosamine-6-phosphate deacetylase n=1 Tax=Jiangella mangrovi TaxID=1524084 RepID=A0A7W9GX86_9ACTN|nr:amidohydrolase family protein [Jiangella mangrovi]MBB5791747.1 N-acetylglucosamine-6-phosphate deacetylase [Jiangella mangrovi]